MSKRKNEAIYLHSIIINNKWNEKFDPDAKLNIPEKMSNLFIFCRTLQLISPPAVSFNTQNYKVIFNFAKTELSPIPSQDAGSHIGCTEKPR